MSETAVFVIGVVVFAITVWGIVMAGGIALSRVAVEQNPELGKPVEEDEPDERRRCRLK